MVQWGFVSSGYNPCMFMYADRSIVCLVHGDDLVSVGSRSDLQWMKERLAGRFEVKTQMVGPRADLGDVSEARILNRVIRVTPQGWEYEADQRHADLIIREADVEKKSVLTHPGGDKKVIDEEDSSPELTGPDATRFRGVAARANYLAADRPDIQYSVKELCRRMAKPRQGDWNKLLRVALYLNGA